MTRGPNSRALVASALSALLLAGCSDDASTSGASGDTPMPDAAVAPDAADGAAPWTDADATPPGDDARAPDGSGGGDGIAPVDAEADPDSTDAQRADSRLDPDEDTPAPVECPYSDGAICEGDTLWFCDDLGAESSRDCEALGLTCGLDERVDAYACIAPPPRCTSMCSGPGTLLTVCERDGGLGRGAPVSVNCLDAQQICDLDPGTDAAACLDPSCEAGGRCPAAPEPLASAPVHHLSTPSPVAEGGSLFPHLVEAELALVGVDAYINAMFSNPEIAAQLLEPAATGAMAIEAAAALGLDATVSLLVHIPIFSVTVAVSRAYAGAGCLALDGATASAALTDCDGDGSDAGEWTYAVTPTGLELHVSVPAKEIRDQIPFDQAPFANTLIVNPLVLRLRFEALP